MKLFYFFLVLLAVKVAFAQGNLQDILDSAASGSNKTVVLEGEYFITEPIKLTEKHSGIYVESRSGATVNAGVKITGWQQEGGLFKAKLNTDRKIFSIYVNGKRATLARHPNNSANFLHSPAPSDVSKDFSDNNFGACINVFSKDLEILNGLSEAELKDVYFDFYVAWNNIKYSLISLKKNPDAETALLHILTSKAYNMFRWDKAPRFQILNAKSAIDEEGEFCYNSASKTLYYKPRQGETLENIDAYAPLLNVALYASGANIDRRIRNITFENIRFKNGSQTVLDTPQTLQFMGQASNEAESFLTFNLAENVNIINCKISNCDAYAIGFEDGVINSRIENCEIYDSGSGGIRIGRKKSKIFPASETDPDLTWNISVKNNIIYSYGRFNQAGVGILIQDCGQISIEDNTVFDGFYTGISVGWTWGDSKNHTQKNNIIGNKIFNIGQGRISDMGGIYTLGIAEDSKISGNEIFNVSRHRYGGWGIYNDEGSALFTIENNYVHDNQDCGYFMHYGKNILVQNNIFENAETTMFGLGKTYDDSFSFERNIVIYDGAKTGLFRHGAKLQAKHAKFNKNIYFDKSDKYDFSGLNFEAWQARGQDVDSLIINPNLKNYTPQNPNFKKIGFIPFPLNKAGVKGKMKLREAAILKNYIFPLRWNDPEESPHNIHAISDFAVEKVGAMPQLSLVMNDYGKRDVIIAEDAKDKEKYLLMRNSHYEQSYKPAIVLKPRIISGVALAKFKLRLNAESQTSFILRGDGIESKTPTLSFRSGSVETKEGLRNLPLNEWLDVEVRVGTGKLASNTWGYKIFQKNKLLLANDEIYECATLKNIDWAGFIMPENQPNTVDIKEIKIISETK